MRTAFGKVLVGYEVPVGPDINAEVLEEVYFGLPGFAAHTPPRIHGDVWRMAVYYLESTRDDPTQLRNQFQNKLENKLDRVVNIEWFDVGASSTMGGLEKA